MSNPAHSATIIYGLNKKGPVNKVARSNVPLTISGIIIKPIPNRYNASSLTHHFPHSFSIA